MKEVSSSRTADTLSGIQILRAVAVFMVVFHHADWVVKSNFAIEHWPTFGAAGVDLFFVISGFIICLTTSRTADAGQFMRKRLVRIVPLYWLTTFITFVIMCADERFLDWQEVSAINLVKSLLFIPYAGGGGVIQPILYVGWSLSYEMLFYILWAMTLVLFPGSIGRRVLLTGGILTVLVVIGILVGPTKAVARFFVHPIMLEFVVGAGIGWAYVYGRSFFAGAPLSIGAAAIALALMMLAQFSGRGTPRAAVAGLAATVVIVVVLALEARGAPLRNTLLETLGSASYAIYLTHPLIIAVARHAAILDWMEPGFARLLASSLALPTAIACIGIAAYYAFERPINLWLRDRRGRSRHPGASAEASVSSASKVPG
jgi:exopolysaccharide production protein ExoZ